jgi:hypothetical protein
MAASMPSTASGETRSGPESPCAWGDAVITVDVMCRNIHTLHNFEPAATSEEVHAAALQYVRKIAGTTKPSKANQEAFDHAVHEIAHITQHLLDDLVATTPPKNREEEAAKARARAVRSGRYAAASA